MENERSGLNHSSTKSGQVQSIIKALNDTGPYGANHDIKLVQVTNPLGTQNWQDTKAFVDWVATQLNISVDDLEHGRISIDTVTAKLEALGYTYVTNNKEKFKAAVGVLLSGKEEPHDWWAAQEESLTVDSAVAFIEDLQKGGLTNDLKTLADGLQLAGLIHNWDGNPSHVNSLMQDSQFVSAVDSLIAAFQHGSGRSDFAAASAVASQIAAKLKGGAAADVPYVSAVASVLGDISKMFAGGGGPGSLLNDAQDVEAMYGTAEALIPLAHIPMVPSAQLALTKVGFAIGDVVAIIQGFDEGGVLGGAQAGWAASALAKVLSSLPHLGLGGLGPYAIPIGIAIGLAAMFFGGNHDNPQNMPDKYDTENYGQNTANLRGTMGASGINFTEETHLTSLFGGRTGIQAIEETLAMYGTAANAPNWLKPMFGELEAKFGESATGSGVLSIGINGSGKDCNNQQVVGVSGTDGQVYQYGQLDAALNEFQAAYAKAVAAGQASSFAWDSFASPGSPPPSNDINSTSYQSNGQWYA